MSAMSGAPSPDMAPRSAQSVSLPQVDAASPGCAAMNAILVDALANTPEGQAFTSAVNAAQPSEAQWFAFTSSLNHTKREALAQAASDDISAQALAAFDEYFSAQTALSDGSLIDPTDPAQEGHNLEAQRQQANPKVLEAQARLTQAHIRLCECMPNWPVLF